LPLELRIREGDGAERPTLHAYAREAAWDSTAGWSLVDGQRKLRRADVFPEIDEQAEHEPHPDVHDDDQRDEQGGDQDVSQPDLRSKASEVAASILFDVEETCSQLGDSFETQQAFQLVMWD